jgi:hypothetical protein
MAKQYTFGVTKQDIADALEGDSFNCMVAETIKRQQPGASHVEVDLQTIRWSDKEGRHVFLTPYEVAGYIVAFDAGEEIHPFEFRLRNAVQALQRKALTPAAKAANKADSKLAHARRKLRKAENVIQAPQSSPAEIALAEERAEEAEQTIAEAKRERAEVVANGKAEGMKTSKERTSEATRMAAPRVIKTKKRVYGARHLRVNQVEGRTHTVSRDV